MSRPDNRRQLVVMTVGALVGGVLGGLCGLLVLSPAILIPIGVVLGLSLALARLRHEGDGRSA